MRIRKRSQLIPPGSVVFDLDGTIIDQRQNYRQAAAKRGYRLNFAQCNYNLIKQHVPGDILREIDELVLGDATRNAEPFSGALEVVRAYSSVAFIASARPTDFQRSALGWLNDHLPMFSHEQVIFFPSTAAKGKILSQFELSVAVDDQLAPLKALPTANRRLVFDPDAALADDIVAGVTVVRSWKEIQKILESTVRPGV